MFVKLDSAVRTAVGSSEATAAVLQVGPYHAGRLCLTVDIYIVCVYLMG